MCIRDRRKPSRQRGILNPSGRVLAIEVLGVGAACIGYNGEERWIRASRENEQRKQRFHGLSEGLGNSGEPNYVGRLPLFPERVQTRMDAHGGESEVGPCVLLLVILRDRS